MVCVCAHTTMTVQSKHKVWSLAAIFVHLFTVYSRAYRRREEEEETILLWVTSFTNRLDKIYSGVLERVTKLIHQRPQGYRRCQTMPAPPPAMEACQSLSSHSYQLGLHSVKQARECHTAPGAGDVLTSHLTCMKILWESYSTKGKQLNNLLDWRPKTSCSSEMIIVYYVFICVDTNRWFAWNAVEASVLNLHNLLNLRLYTYSHQQMLNWLYFKLQATWLTPISPWYRFPIQYFLSWKFQGRNTPWMRFLSHLAAT